MANSSRVRVLVFAEGATLAHIARPLALTALLDASLFDVTLACPRSYQWATAQYPWPIIDLNTQDSNIFIQQLAAGRPLYSLETLESYVEEDLRLIQAYQPDVVLGDFRLSLAISAHKQRVPFVTLSNAYWSPAYRQPMPTPPHPLLDKLPAPLAQTLFQTSYPFISFWHARAINQLRKKHGLPTGRSLKEAYTDADIVALCDWPFSYTATQFPDNHQFIGPVVWSPPIELPSWWNKLDGNRPLIYITLGSSGNPKLLSHILQALSGRGYQLAVATANIPLQNPAQYPDVYWADYLPGNILSKRATLIICNGGSLTTQQALIAGKPIVGIPNNLDQLLNMQCVEQLGAGVTLALRTTCCASEQIINTVTCSLQAAPSNIIQMRTIAKSLPTPSQALASILKRIGRTP